MEKVKVGIIGCGGMGHSHARQIAELEDAEVVAAADLNEEILAGYKEEFGVANGYADYNEMLSNEELDAVTVCLPTWLHRDAVVAAAESKRAVLCEKPLARTMAEGEDMVAACKAGGVPLQLGFVRRFDNTWLKVKEIVESGVLGKPIVWRDIRAGFGPGHTAWFFDKDKGGGPILDGMVHNFDFANFMFGCPVKVSSGLTQFKNSTAIDTGAIWMEYESGHIMSNMWSWGMAEKVNAFSGMDMIAPKGALIFARNFDASEFKDQYDPETEGIHLLKKEGGTVEPVIYKLNKMTLDQMRHFIDCVKNGTEPCVNGDDGLLALKAALAALQEEKL